MDTNNLLSDSADSIIKILENFGLDKTQAQIYLSILENKELTALKLSRINKIPRTRVYRILEKLVKLGIVIEKVNHNGNSFIISPISQFEMIIKDKEVELEKLKFNKKILFNEIDKVKLELNNESKIVKYQGIEGLKQVFWNTTKCKGVFRIFEIADMSRFLDYGFAEKVREEFLINQIKVREITNLKQMKAWTNVEDFVAKCWECRYIDSDKLQMKSELVVYNDVYAIYNEVEGEIFCLEIYDAKLAQMQKQLFDYIWDNGQEMIIGRGGVAQIKE